MGQWGEFRVKNDTLLCTSALLAFCCFVVFHQIFCVFIISGFFSDEDRISATEY